jgi:hypothetical protein
MQQVLGASLAAKEAFVALDDAVTWHGTCSRYAKRHRKQDTGDSAERGDAERVLQCNSKRTVNAKTKTRFFGSTAA